MLEGRNDDIIAERGRRLEEVRDRLRRQRHDLPLVIMVIRMDYVHGDHETEMYVNGKKVGNSVCPGNDRRFRWRNWPFVIPGEYVTEPNFKIKQIPITAGRDINLFKIWFYQPI